MSVVAAAGEGAAAEGLINPHDVRFTQDTIKYGFSNEGEGTIDDMAAALRSGKLTAKDVPPIRLVEHEGQLYTLDNRRLEAFRRADVHIRFRMATAKEIAREFSRKFRTQNLGTAIRVRGQ